MEVLDNDKRRFIRWISGVGLVSLAGCSDGGDEAIGGPTTVGETSTTDRSTSGEQTTTEGETSAQEEQGHVQYATKLQSSSPDSAAFGVALGLDGDTALIGSRNTVEIFERSSNGWSHELNLPDLSFSGEVSIQGDTALVGSPFENDHAGTVFVFEGRGDKWHQQATLTGDDLNEGRAGSDQFGVSVALDNNRALIGAVGAFREGIGSTGAAYIFKQTEEGWHQEAKLAAEDGEEKEAFGFTTAIDGDTAVIGAPKSPHKEEPGAAYVFERTGGNWTQKTKLAGDDVQTWDAFGGFIALQDSTIMIGAPWTPVSNSADGTVYVYERTNGSWHRQTKFLPDKELTTHFGQDVALDDDIALIGDPSVGGTEGRGVSAGAVHLYNRSATGWRKEVKFFPDDISGGHQFGGLIALDDSTALIGTFPDNEANEVYVYEF